MLVETLDANWFYPGGIYHTGHYPLDCLNIPLSAEGLAIARARDPSVELERALAALSDGWERWEGSRNYLLEKTHRRAETRSPSAASAFWGARRLLEGQNLCDPNFLPVFHTLARLELAKILALETLPSPEPRREFRLT